MCPLIIGVCYVPPAGSHQLHGESLQHRFMSLTSHLATACGEGEVFLAGDMNARVGSGLDTNASHIPARQGLDDSVNIHGRELLTMCRMTGCTLCTGRVLGDCPPVCSLRARSNMQPTRPDHELTFPYRKSHGGLPRGMYMFPLWKMLLQEAFRMLYTLQRRVMLLAPCPPWRLRCARQHQQPINSRSTASLPATGRI